MVNLENVEKSALAARALAERAGWERPWVRVWDKNGNLRGELAGEIEASFEELLNDAGDGQIVLPAEHPLAQWSLNLPVEELFSVTVEDPTLPRPWDTRWSGISTSVELDVDDDDQQTVRWQLVHDYVQLKHVICWSNPLAPIQLQWPKSAILAGPAETTIKTFLLLNLWRIYSGGWKLPDPLFDPEAWRSRFTMMETKKWPIFVLPAPPLARDTTPWTVLASRFSNFHDLVADTLSDGQLRLKVWRWLPGDPQPTSTAVLTEPTVCVDIVEQSGATDVTGTLIDGLVKWTKQLGDGGIEDVWSRVLDPSLPTTGRHDDYEELPVYRDSEHTGIGAVPGAGMTVTKPTSWQVVHGGKSPDWVNSGAKLVVNAALGWLGMLIGNPSLGIGVFDDQITDVVLAFGQKRSERRWQAMGRFGPPEHWVASGSTGFSLSGLQARRIGMHDTRGHIAYHASVDDGAPYRVGRHFWLGDRVGVEIAGTIWVSRVTAARRSWSRDKDSAWEISIGEDQGIELPEARLLKKLERIGSVIQAIGVDA